ncbi:hypothetical protein GJAV_G00124030 [Gymnothorax javanicus]|nr:hypothetical protein GJAV_G00124030 [Gymnothorax javanicus]
MDSMVKSKGETKPLRNESCSKSLMLSTGTLSIATCFLLSLSSIAICLMTSFKASQLEHRVHALEMEKRSALHQSDSVLAGDGIKPALQEAIEKVVQEMIAQTLPKLRAPREVAQECACLPVFRNCGCQAEAAFKMGQEQGRRGWVVRVQRSRPLLDMSQWVQNCEDKTDDFKDVYSREDMAEMRKKTGQ